jgi:ribosomal protein L6P/L9E
MTAGKSGTKKGFNKKKDDLVVGSRSAAMKFTQKRLQFKVVKGVTLSIEAREVTVTGPRGKLTVAFKHMPLDIYFLEGSEERVVVVERWFTGGKASASLRTAVSHIENAMTGVTKGFQYKMRFVYSHFPINVSITNGTKRVEIRNFLGEKVIRVVECLKGARGQARAVAAVCAQWASAAGVLQRRQPGEGGIARHARPGTLASCVMIPPSAPRADTTVKRSEDIKDEIVLSGNDIDAVSRTWCAGEPPAVGPSPSLPPSARHTPRPRPLPQLASIRIPSPPCTPHPPPLVARSSRTCATSRTRTSESSSTASTSRTRGPSSSTRPRQLWEPGGGERAGASGVCMAASGCGGLFGGVSASNGRRGVGPLRLRTALGVCAMHAGVGRRAQKSISSLRCGEGHGVRPPLWMGEGLPVASCIRCLPSTLVHKTVGPVIL